MALATEAVNGGPSLPTKDTEGIKPGTFPIAPKPLDPRDDAPQVYIDPVQNLPILVDLGGAGTVTGDPRPPCPGGCDGIQLTDPAPTTGGGGGGGGVVPVGDQGSPQGGAKIAGAGFLDTVTAWIGGNPELALAILVALALLATGRR